MYQEETHETRKKLIETMRNEHKTLKEIGKALGNISRQRIYQLIQRYNLSHLIRHKRGFWKQQSNEAQWLHRTLLHKQLPKQDRQKLYDYLQDKLPTHCPIFGYPLDYIGRHTFGKRSYNSPSIDKINPKDGYNPLNVQIISWKANRLKSDGTIKEHEQIAAYLKKLIVTY